MGAWEDPTFDTLTAAHDLTAGELTVDDSTAGDLAVNGSTDGEEPTADKLVTAAGDSTAGALEANFLTGAADKLNAGAWMIKTTVVLTVAGDWAAGELTVECVTAPDKL